MKLKIFVSGLVICLAAFVIYSAVGRGNFKPAEDFPRGALVYVQVADLPALVKLWNESELKGKYAESENFADFKNRHLGLKLASRWAEFNAASGFPIDLETVGGLADKRAAVALYDVGKLEFVFVAPVADEVFAATKFAQNQNNFEEQTLGDGTVIYRARVEADRGRQKQELIFASANGRFVLATSEKLLAQTLTNINGGAAKNRLIDEPSFGVLSGKIEPHAATVWVNQTALNEDYYFKRYWLMPETEKLKNIRAGVFDFSIEEGKFVEHRRFLLDKPMDSAPIESERAADALSFLPAETPFYRLREANRKTLDESVQNTIFERRKDGGEKSADKPRIYTSSFDGDDEFSSGGGDGDYSNENFDETIDEIDEAETVERRGENVDFSKFFQSANARAILTFTEPRVLPAPLFVEFNRAAIFSLASPTGFDRDAFEAAAARKFSEQTTISAADAPLKWQTKTENGVTLRELQLPMLGLSAGYATRGGELILTNDAEFLRKILENQNSEKIEKADFPLTELTVLNLERREEAFDRIFAEVDENDGASDFFTGNVASLIDSFSGIKKVEIKANYSGNLLEETIVGSW